MHTGRADLALPHTGGGMPGLYLRAFRRGGRRCGHSGLQALLLPTADSSIIRVRWNAHENHSSSAHRPLEPLCLHFQGIRHTVLSLRSCDRSHMSCRAHCAALLVACAQALNASMPYLHLTRKGPPKQIQMHKPCCHSWTLESRLWPGVLSWH